MRRFSGVLGWVAVTAAAFGISMAAVTLVGSSIGDPVANPLSAEQVRRQLAVATASPTATPTTTPTGPTTGTPGKPSGSPTSDHTVPTGRRTVLASGGGTVTASCTGGLVRLEFWSLANGFRTTHVDRGPDRSAEIEFESEHDRYKLEISCVAGVPTAQIEHDLRDGNSGPGGGAGRGGSGPD